MATRHRIEDVRIEGFDALTLHSAEGLSATFVPTAGMVGSSLRDGEAELLGAGAGLRAYVDDGRWFGIPLLHPWANRLARSGPVLGDVRVELADEGAGVRRDANGLPIHGLLFGARDWRVVARGADDEAAFVEARIDFSADPARSRAFPFPHGLAVRASISRRTLTVTTRLEPSGERAVPVAFGWHPYFRLPDVPRAEWHVELPVATRAELDPRCLPTGTIEPVEIPPGALGDRTFDDLFPQIHRDRPFVLAGGGRRIEVAFGAAYDVAVVYAPAHEDVVCFEPMTMPTDPFSGRWPLRWVPPGESFEASFSIRVLPDFSMRARPGG